MSWILQKNAATIVCKSLSDFSTCNNGVTASQQQTGLPPTQVKFLNTKFERRIQWQRIRRVPPFIHLAILVLLCSTLANHAIGQSSFATGWNLNRGHNGEVLDISVSPNGKFGVTAGEDYSLKIWDLETTKIFAEVSGLSSPVSAIAFASDNIHFVTGDRSGRMYIRNVKSPQKATLIGSIETGEKPASVTDIAWHPTENTFIACGSSTSYAIWKTPKLGSGEDVVANDQRPTVKRLDGRPLFTKRHLSVSGNGKRIAFHHGRDEIRIASWPDLEIVKKIKIRSGMNSIAISLNNNGTKLIAGTGERITVWDLTDTVATKSVKTMNRCVSVGFLPEEKSAWSCGSPDIWSMPEMKLSYSFANKKQKRTAFTAACAAGNLLLAGNRHGDVFLMRADDSPKILKSWQRIGSNLKRIEFSDDGRMMLLESNTRDANRYPQTQSTVFQLTSDGGPMMNKLGKWYLSRSGQHVCNADSNSADNKSLWAEVSAGTFYNPSNANANRSRRNAAFAAPVCFLPTGDAMIGDSQFPSAKRKRTARFYDLGDSSYVTANAMSRDGKIFATGHGGTPGLQNLTVGKAAIYDVATGELIQSKKFNFSHVRYVNFSPSGSLAFLSMLEDSMVINIASGEIINRIPRAGFGFFRSENSVVIYGKSSNITTVDLAKGEVTNLPGASDQETLAKSQQRLFRSKQLLNPHSVNSLKCDDSRQLIFIHAPYRRVSDVRDTKSGKVVGTLPKNIRGQFFCCAKTKQIFVDNGLGDSPERVTIFDFEKNKLGSLKTLPVGNLKAVSSDGKSLLYAEANLQPDFGATWKPGSPPPPRTYAIYDSKSGERKRELGNYFSACKATFSPDDKRIVLRPSRQFQLGSDEPKILILDAATGQTLSTIQTGAWHLPDLCFSRDGKKLLLAANISPEALRRFGEWTTMEKLPDPPEKVKEVQELTQAWDAVKLWSTKTGKMLARIDGHESPIRKIQFSHDGTTLLAESESQATLWDVTKNRALLKVDRDDSVLHNPFKRHAPVKFDREMNQIYVLRNNRIEAYSGRSGERLFEMDPVDGFHRGHFVAKNQFLALESTAARLLDFSKATKPKLNVSFLCDSPIVSATRRPSVSQLATIHADATVRFWNMANGKEIIRIQLFGNPRDWLASKNNGEFFGSDGIEDLLTPATLQSENTSKETITGFQNNRVLESLDVTN